MSRPITAHVAVVLFVAVACASCAAEHLEPRDPKHGVTDSSSSTTRVTRPTELRATETQVEGDRPLSGNAVYRCPMHHEVQSSSPGTCSRCGMTLEKLEGSP